MRLAAVLFAAALATPAAALDFIPRYEEAPVPGTVRLTLLARGEVEAGDSDRFAAALDAALAPADGRSVVRPVTVEFDSPGGSLSDGLLIGAIIRDLGAHTVVPEDAICASACTWAFIGGVRRTALGAFGVHAVSVEAKADLAADSINPLLSRIQARSALLVSFTKDMVGDDRMALVALEQESEGIAWLDDATLTEFRVITVAARPTQYLPATEGYLTDCADPYASPLHPTIIRTLCEDLDLSRAYAEIGSLTAELAPDSRAAEAVTVQAPRFEAVWTRCGLPRFDAATDRYGDDPALWPHNCMAEMFTARLTQLRALRDFYAATDGEPARSGWVAQPIE
jgi:hypothetical protein